MHREEKEDADDPPRPFIVDKELENTVPVWNPEARGVLRSAGDLPSAVDGLEIGADVRVEHGELELDVREV